MDRSRAIRLALALAVAGLVAWWALGRSSFSVERVGPKPSAGSQVVVLLHGYGAPGDDLVGLAKEFSRTRPEVTFLMPAGPHRVDLSGRSWVPDFSAPTREDYVVRLAVEVRATIAQLWKVIDAARRRGVACKDITVGGFSQGGRIAVQLALTAPDDCPLGGVIVMSGGGSRELAMPPATGRPKMRALVTHGRQDRVVRWDEGEATAKRFAEGGHEVRAVWFDGGHRIPPVVREAIPGWLGGESVGERVE